MTVVFHLAWKSAWNRRFSVLLAMSSIAISMTLLLGVDKIRKEAKNSFLNTISQTDLIVGARSGPINLLLYSVFRIGNATNNVSYQSYQDIINDRKVKWAIPLSLGDSHRGFRVLGTSQAYFKHYRYADKQTLQFDKGQAFDDLYDTVVGAEVAHKLGYQLGDNITLSHGAGKSISAGHDDKPFRISGILEATGTPVDHTVHVSLEAIEAIHIDWQAGARSRLQINAEQARNMGLKPKTVTAFMLGLNKRIHTFHLQRQINNYSEEALLAIIPGATLADLWRTLGKFEVVLLAVSTLVLVAGMLGMLTTLLSTLNERRREMAVLRSVGAHSYQILLLLMAEALLIVFLGCVTAIFMLYTSMLALKPFLINNYGFNLTITPLDAGQWLLLLLALLLSLLFSLIPGFIAYRRSLQDGLTIRT
ncbi:MAG: ABC transporter permease [Arenicella sp.]